MPHVIVKMYPGRPEEKKQELADNITRVVGETLNLDDSVISVAVEDIDRDKWQVEVYKPDILGKADTLYKKPGNFPAEGKIK